ncbi:MAG: TRAM domain-containing protein [Candidatus Omnitrophota bacterium]
MAKKIRTNIYTLAFGGSGIGKVDGKVCFVDGALPGEEVLFEVEKDTSRYIKGRALEIISRSEDRVEPACRYYGVCGGCQLQHLSYEKELSYKQEQLVELIKRIAGEKDIECANIVRSPDPYHYRTHVTLHKGTEGYGFYDTVGKDVVKIKKCLIAAEVLNGQLTALSAEGGKDDVTLKADHLGNVWSSDRPGERFFMDEYRGIELSLSPKAFSQANRYIAEKIAETLEEWIGPAGSGYAFFDAYCGVGFFSFLLKNKFDLRVGMDSDRIAIDCAKSTAKKLGLEGIKFYKADAEKEFFDVFNRTKKQENILLIDPPRRGVKKDFLEDIKTHEGVSKIYYLSCDPARLARDVKILTGGNVWKLTRVQPFDMFPRTKHIETLVEFVKA